MVLHPPPTVFAPAVRVSCCSVQRMAGSDDRSRLPPGGTGAGEIETWRRLQEADERLHSPFLSPDFAQAVGAVDRNARVAVIEDGSALIGFFPYSLRHRTIATGLASGISGCTAPIISPEADVDPVRLLKECGLHVWDFAILSRTSRLASASARRAGRPILSISPTATSAT